MFKSVMTVWILVVINIGFIAGAYIVYNMKLDYTPTAENVISVTVKDDNFYGNYYTERMSEIKIEDEELEKYLKYGEENSISIYDIPFRSDWDSIWSKPLVDTDKYALENSRLKPVASALYEGLWSFHKEGRLRMKLGTRTRSDGKEEKIMRFWLED